MSTTATIEKRDVPVNGAELHCEIAGAGEPLLLLHGLGSCSDDWKDQIDYFHVRYRVIACDLRGHGQSSKPHERYSIEGFASDVASLLSKLRTGPTHVVGLSLGGMVAFQLAVDAPELVASLAIVNSGPAVPAATFKQRFPLYIRLAYARLLGLRGMAKVIAKRLFPKPEQLGLQRAFIARLTANDKHCYLASLRAIFAGWSVADRLGEIRCPVLVLASDQDYTPVALKKAYAARLANSTMVVVPDARHALPIEKPREFNAALEKFLECVAADDVGRPLMRAAI